MQRRIDLALMDGYELGSLWLRLVTSRRLDTSREHQEFYAAEQQAIREELELRLAGDDEIVDSTISRLWEKVNAGQDVTGG